MATQLTITTSLNLLNTSIKIPQLGFGIYEAVGPKCVSACVAALKAGYRHIDSAQYYQNEKEMGEAVRQSGLNRSEVFLTTKVLFPSGSVEKTYQSCLESVTNIDGEAGYVDLFLIHNQNCGRAKRKECWLALEKLHKEGKARAIGVSNFGIGSLEEMKEYASIWPPTVNQLELHPWCQQRELDTYCQKHNIVVEAYCPIVRNQKANDPTLGKIATAYGKTPNQILIRYALQKNWVPLPKSENPERIIANADVFGFEISNEDMAKLDGLDQAAKGSIVQWVDNS